MRRTPSRPPHPRVSRSAPSAAGSGGLADQARARLGSTQVAVATPQLGAGRPSLPMIQGHVGQPLVSRPAAPLAASTPRALPSAWGSAEAGSDGDRRRGRARRSQSRCRLRHYGPGPGPIHWRGGWRLSATWAGVQRVLWFLGRSGSLQSSAPRSVDFRFRIPANQAVRCRAEQSRVPAAVESL